MKARLAGSLVVISLIQALLFSSQVLAQPMDAVLVPDAIQRERRESGEWIAVRDAALGRFVLISKGNSRELGLTGPIMLDQIVALDPLREAIVFVEELKTFDGRNAAALIKDQERLMFPVMQGGRVVSSVTIAKLRTGRWVAAAYGSAPLIRLLFHARVAVASLPLAPGSQETLIHPGKRAQYRSVFISGLNQRFLAAQGPGGTYLTPIMDSQEFGFRRGIPLLAEVVLGKLQPAARLHEGLPT
jgi:hypothetical protein